MNLSSAVYLFISFGLLTGCVAVTDLSDQMNVDGSGGDDPSGESTGGAPLTGNTGGTSGGTGGAPLTGNTGGGAATGGASATGGGSATGGAAATGGGSATGGTAATGGASSSVCPAVVCDGQASHPVADDTCMTLKLGEYGGWQINSDTDCAVKIDGVVGKSGDKLSVGVAHEIEVSGCSLPYAALGCYGGV